MYMYLHIPLIRRLLGLLWVRALLGLLLKQVYTCERVRVRVRVLHEQRPKMFGITCMMMYNYVNDKMKGTKVLTLGAGR